MEQKHITKKTKLLISKPKVCLSSKENTIYIKSEEFGMYQSAGRSLSVKALSLIRRINKSEAIFIHLSPSVKTAFTYTPFQHQLSDAGSKLLYRENINLGKNI
jgi:hypothetical protein